MHLAVFNQAGPDWNGWSWPVAIVEEVMSGWNGWSWSDGGWPWLGVVWLGVALLFWASLIALLIWAVRSAAAPRRAPDAVPRTSQTAMEVLRRRLAAGEISPEEFDRIQQLLQD